MKTEDLGDVAESVKYALERLGFSEHELEGIYGEEGGLSTKWFGRHGIRTIYGSELRGDE